MLKAHKMPKEIIDIAKQHHSNSLVQFFYVKAKELNPETEESDFRYPTKAGNQRDSYYLHL